MTITWPPSPDARTSTFLLPPTGEADAMRRRRTSRRPAPPLAPLPAKSLGFNTEATTYHVYATSGRDAVAAPIPYDLIKLPAPLTPQPLAVHRARDPKASRFGVERCFEVRPVDSVAGATVIGPASPRTCVTPKDTFPPAAPRSLAAIAGSGVINLIWDANSRSAIWPATSCCAAKRQVTHCSRLRRSR